MSGENRKIIVTDRANRQKDDFYQTPEWVTRVLLGFHKFDGEIWEPAAGRGDMAEVLKKAGYEVYATDLVNRGYCSAGIDFLFENMRAQNIVTNPPLIWRMSLWKRGLNWRREVCPLAADTLFMRQKTGGVLFKTSSSKNYRNPE